MDAERSSDGLGADRDEVREALPEDAGVGLGFAEDLEAVLASDDDHEHVVRIRVRRAVVEGFPRDLWTSVCRSVVVMRSTRLSRASDAARARA